MNDASPSKLQLILAFASVYLIWGSTYLAIRFAVETIPPFLLGGVRYGIAGVLLYGWCRARGSPKPSRANWLAATIVGALLLGGGNGLVNWSEQWVPSGLTALIVATVPIWFVTLAWLGPERDIPGRLEIVGIVVGLAGVGILMSGSLDTVGLHGATASQVLLGALALSLATILWAAGSIYSRSAPMARPVLFSTALTMVAGGAVLILIGGALGEFGRLDVAAVSRRSWAALAYLIAFGSIIAFSSYAWLIQTVRPALAGTYAYVNPIVAVLLGWAVADEVITGRMAIGAVLVVGAVVLAQRGRTSRVRR